MVLSRGMLQDREGGQAWRGDGKAVHPVLSILVVATNLTANTMEGGRSPLRKLLRDVSQNCSVLMKHHSHHTQPLDRIVAGSPVCRDPAEQHCRILQEQIRLELEPLMQSHWTRANGSRETLMQSTLTPSRWGGWR